MSITSIDVKILRVGRAERGQRICNPVAFGNPLSLTKAKRGFLNLTFLFFINTLLTSIRRTHVSAYKKKNYRTHVSNVHI